MASTSCQTTIPPTPSAIPCKPSKAARDVMRDLFRDDKPQIFVQWEAWTADGVQTLTRRVEIDPFEQWVGKVLQYCKGVR